MSNRHNSDDNNYDKSAPSTLLTARFGYTSARLIHSVEKNLYIVMIVILAIAAISILNILGILDYLYSEDVDYFVDLILSIVLIVVVAPLVFLIVKSRRVLDNWNSMFETNTLSTSLNIVMANRSKAEVLKGLTYSVAQIAEPLQTYIESKKSDLSEFLDVNVNGNNLKFDILLDANGVVDDNSTISNNLKDILRNYGSVVVKIIDGVIDKNTVESFVNSLLMYVSSTKNDIGLGLIIGEELATDAQPYANQALHVNRKKINNLLLLVKPSTPQIKG
ncbi:MAG: hypothetical protein WB511_12070 [Nitrososphaeraceae archaeon]